MMELCSRSLTFNQEVGSSSLPGGVATFSRFLLVPSYFCTFLNLLVFVLFNVRALVSA